MMKSIVAGIVGTVVMTAVMMLAGMMGMPVMSPPHMLAGAMGLPVAVGFAMHFAIGIIFAIGYTYLFKVNISNIWLKGVVFGVVAFIAAQIGIGGMGIIFPIPDPEGPMALSPQQVFWDILYSEWLSPK